MSKRLPALFVGHGSPTMALESDAYTRALHQFGAHASGVEAVVVVSAHWEREVPVRVTAAARPPLIYDFYGFPKEMYELGYPAPGKPALARELARTLSDGGLPVEKDEARGLDHGCWVPLLHLFPDANVPVLQVSIPRPRDPAALVDLGRRLAPFRERGVLLVGSGNVVHNLRRVNWEKDAPPEDWAVAFDGWFREKIETMDVAGAADFRAAPANIVAVPTTEHYDPALVVLGAASEGERAKHVFEGIYNGNVSMRCFALDE